MQRWLNAADWRRGSWGALVMLLLVGLLAATTLPAYAAGKRETRAWGHGVVGFWMAGEITAVEDETVTLLLPQPQRARGMMRHITVEATMAVDADSVLLNGELGAVDTDDLRVGDKVVVVPRLVWGNLTVRLLFMGSPEDLSDAAYMGRVVAEQEASLTVLRGRDTLTVLVDEDTVWYDHGRAERPAELPEELVVQMLAVPVEGEEDTVRAALITPRMGGF